MQQQQHQQSVVTREVGRSSKGKDDPWEEERRKLVEETVLEGVGNMKKVRHPHTVRYVERKMAEKGIHRMDRHPGDGVSLAHGPPKSGHGGKFTWEGPIDAVECELDPVPPAIDPRDPNYVPDDDDDDDDDDDVVEKLETVNVEEEEEEAEKPLVIGEVEVAKAAEAKEGVSRIEVRPLIAN